MNGKDAQKRRRAVKFSRIPKPLSSSRPQRTGCASDLGKRIHIIGEAGFKPSSETMLWMKPGLWEPSLATKPTGRESHYPQQ
jgi:hypothetical protein